MFARLISLIRFCSNELADIVLIVREQVAQEELRFLALEQMRRHAAELALIRRYVRRCAKDAAAEEGANYRQVTKLIGQARPFRLPFDLTGPISEGPVDGAEGARTIAVVIRRRLTSCWVQLKSVDQVVGEYAEEFGGEDALQPQIRGFLDDALGRCEALSDAMEDYVGPWDLPGDLGEALVLTRKLAVRALT